MSFELPEKKGLYDPAFEHDACGVGFVANINGDKSHQLIEHAITVLVNLTHRGACGSDPATGDGAGFLFQLPDEFFRYGAAGLDFELPPPGRYGVGMLFLPTQPFARYECMRIIEDEASAMGARVIGWRDVPLDRSALGTLALSRCPEIKQVFITGPDEREDDFERRLYLIRRRAEEHIFRSDTPGMARFHVPSMSSRTIVYKGMMLAHQVPRLYPDLASPALKSALVVVHQRYSTNTFPTWALAQPFRFLGHNGEINTLRGNINNMYARLANLKSDVYNDKISSLFPVIVEGGSDSAMLDNALEFLILGGRSLAHSLMMLVPEAWGDKYYMGNDRRAFYEYHAMFMEPWDGPAALVCSDGRRVGATLDRNGLRPARYVITKEGLVVHASEVGVLDIPPSEIAVKGRLSPGKMILVDTEQKRFLGDHEIKAYVCRRKPYRRWVEANRIMLRGLFDGTGTVVVDRDHLVDRQRVYGYTREDINTILRPMVQDGKEPVGSMGDDTPMAVLSEEPRLLFNYFKQLFAQVTNPAIDPIREDLVMSLTTYIGPQGNILGENPNYARMLKLDTPILSNVDLGRIRAATVDEFKTVTLDAVFDCHEGPEGMVRAIERIQQEAVEAIRNGCSVVIVSDRKVDKSRAPIPSLLATAAVNRQAVKEGLRTKVSLITESGEPREVMHFALLLGFGATAVNPYLAFETIGAMLEDGFIKGIPTIQDALDNYIMAIEKGLLKIFSKMGISTLRSYRGAQIFQALGLSQDFVDKYFTNTHSPIGGIGSLEVAAESLMRHGEAYDPRPAGPQILPPGGDYAVRRNGRRHMWSVDAIRHLQRAVWNNDGESFAAFSREINDQEGRNCTLRSLFEFNQADPVPLDEVEPAEAIVKRFMTGAMSFGSLSREVHETMAIAMNRLGGRSNSGEGGEDRDRYTLLPNGDNRCSATKQVASGRFGVTTEYLVNAGEIQIKIAQGAKPGEGGQLPGHKVNHEIARVRHSTPGVSLISPPPHHDIYSIEDLAQLIFDLKNVNPDARINVKLVGEVGVGTIAAGVAKGHADAILISGGDGGTGASPLSSIKHAGVPWELGLPETHQVLVQNDLRGRVTLQTDGQIRTGRDVAIAALLGAEEFGVATAALVSLGCVMMRKCHQNTCPMGVATQDPRLRERFKGKPEHLVNYFHFVAEELRQIMSELGFRKIEEMVGRTDKLKLKEKIDHWKARHLDFSRILYRPDPPSQAAVRCVQAQDHGIADVLDRRLIEKARPALENKKRVKIEMPIRNVNRTTGAMLSGMIAKKYGEEGLPPDTITLQFNGSAGQSFGAFGMRGIRMILEGDCNDYIGKALSGAKIIVRPPAGTRFDPARNVIIGNVALYGATSGEVYINGLAGERFCIRNSGANAVVEGVGDHGCEYMTGGLVVVLGKTGVNFAAGMSGGIAYVFDPEQDFDRRCNLAMVDIEPVIDPEDVQTLRSMIQHHLEYTGSTRAGILLDDWDHSVSLFVKVIPMEYRRALGLMAQDDMDSRRTKAEEVAQA